MTTETKANYTDTFRLYHPAIGYRNLEIPWDGPTAPDGLTQAQVAEFYDAHWGANTAAIARQDQLLTAAVRSLFDSLGVSYDRDAFDPYAFGEYLD